MGAKNTDYKFRVNELLKDVFMAVCKENNTGAATEIRTFIEHYIEKFLKIEGVSADLSQEGLEKVKEYLKSKNTHITAQDNDDAQAPGQGDLFQSEQIGE